MEKSPPEYERIYFPNINLNTQKLYELTYCITQLQTICITISFFSLTLPNSLLHPSKKKKGNATVFNNQKLLFGNIKTPINEMIEQMTIFLHINSDQEIENKMEMDVEVLFDYIMTVIGDEKDKILGEIVKEELSQIFPPQLNSLSSTLKNAHRLIAALSEIKL